MELSVRDRKVLKVIVPILKQAKGKKRAVTNSQLRRECLPIPVSDQKIRKLVRHIRLHRKITLLISSSKGYFRTRNQREIKRYLASLKDRCKSIWDLHKALDAHLNNKNVVIEDTLQNLSQEELDALSVVVDVLKSAIGKANIITNKRIRTMYCPQITDNRRLRAIIRCIRFEGYIKYVLSNSNGYWLSRSRKEVRQFMASLKSQCNAIWDVYKVIDEQRLK